MIRRSQTLAVWLFAALTLLAISPASAIQRMAAAPAIWKPSQLSRPDTLLARLRRAAEVHIYRLGFHEPNCAPAPGQKGCLFGRQIAEEVKTPSREWKARLVAVLSKPSLYPQGEPSNSAPFDRAPEIGVRFRDSTGVTDLALCCTQEWFLIASTQEDSTPRQFQLMGRFGVDRPTILRLVKAAFPDDPEVQFWPDSVVAPPPGTIEDFVDVGNRFPQRGDYVYRDDEPLLIKAVPVKYPDDARSAKISGKVVLNVLVGTDGRVKETRIEKGIPELNAAAVEAVQQYLFKPALANNKPVAVWVAVPITFKAP